MSVRLVRNLSLAALVLIVSASMASAQTYWFESYENAVDMIEGQEREEIEEALVLLTALVTERPVPQSDVRVPGDRYIDYLPYFQKARIELQLGKYDEANKSLNISEAFPAVKENVGAMNTLREMRNTLSQQVAVKP